MFGSPRVWHHALQWSVAPCSAAASSAWHSTLTRGCSCAQPGCTQQCCCSTVDLTGVIGHCADECIACLTCATSRAAGVDTPHMAAVSRLRLLPRRAGPPGHPRGLPPSRHGLCWSRQRAEGGQQQPSTTACSLGWRLGAAAAPAGSRGASWTPPEMTVTWWAPAAVASSRPAPHERGGGPMTRRPPGDLGAAWAAADAHRCLLLPHVLVAGAQLADPLWDTWGPHVDSYSGLCAYQPRLTGSVV